ncbi:GLEYA domain-containing protein [Stachybotrys elegans]|uniref:GLEYA domain-containing protein n=1 Tax=Stachybotrys elegans TaxID=80388 RepID=A0A8K0T127_9HYPO|nr:GLEYA domain-containing protein [Stachybotrys elegans]
MKTLTLFLLQALAACAVDVCQNNCGRAVAGTARLHPPLSERWSMCSTALIRTSTITPPAATVTAPITYIRHALDSQTTGSTELAQSGKPGYASACTDDAAYESACQCFADITPSTVTATAATPTETLPGPTCTQGVEFAMYNYDLNTTRWDNLEDAIDYGHAWVNFTLQFSGVEPNLTGITSTLGGVSQQSNPDLPIDIYGVSGPPGSTLGRTVIDHRGYIVPQIAGFHMIWLESSDNAVYAWVGDRAVRGWTASNASIRRFWPHTGGLETWIFDVRDRELGTPIPFRFLWLNYGGPGAFRASISDPRGSNLLSPTTGLNSRIISSCSGPGAPAAAWAPWANEI